MLLFTRNFWSSERRAMLALALPSRDKSHNEVINSKLETKFVTTKTTAKVTKCFQSAKKNAKKTYDTAGQ